MALFSIVWQVYYTQEMIKMTLEVEDFKMNPFNSVHDLNWLAKCQVNVFLFQRSQS